MKRTFTGKRFALTLMVLISACLSQAAFGQDSLRVDLNKALEIALSESPTVKIADREIKRKEYSSKEQRAALLPNISAAASYSRVVQKQVMVMGSNSFKVGTDNSWSAGLNLALPVVSPTLWKTIKLSQTDIELAVESARSSRISLVCEVKKAYYTLLLSKDSYRVLLLGYNNAKLNEKNITDRFDQGLVSEYDKLRAEVQSKNLIPALTAAESAIYLSTMQLKVLMGLDVVEPIIFEGQISDFEDQMSADLSYLIREPNFENNSDLRQLELQAKQLEQTLAINKASRLPSLSLSGNYQWSSLNSDFRIGHYQWNPYAVVGLTLSVPIFEGRAKTFKERQSVISIQNMELQRENLVRNLELSANNFMNNIERSIKEVGSNKESIFQAEKAYSISQKRYDVGSGTYLDMNNSELMLTQSRLAYTQSVYNYLAARADLEKTVGEGMPAQK